MNNRAHAFLRERLKRFQMQPPSHSSIPTLLYSLWEKIMSKVSQKSEVLNLRYINVCQYHKYYLKY